MTPEDFYHFILVPSTTAFPFKDSLESRVMAMAISGQESGWQNRRQTNGPARGFWQCERNGGVLGVLTHPASKATAAAFCEMLEVPASIDAVYEAIAWCDPLAYAVARLLLWTDPHPLPALGDQAGAWACYQRNWRPGHPRPETWADRYASALAIAGAV